MLRWARAHQLVTAMALGITVRLASAAAASGPSRFEFQDSTTYLAVARSLPGGLWSPSAHVATTTLARTPLYPLLIRLTGGDRTLWLTVLAQCVIGGALNVWLVHRLAARISGDRAAVVAALVVALDPASVHHSHLVATETLATTLLLATLLATHRAMAAARQGASLVRPAALVGAATAGLALTRPNLVVFVVAAPVLVAASVPGRRAAGGGAVALLVGLVVVGAWVARNDHVSGRPVLSTVAGQNLTDFGLASIAAERGQLPWRSLDRSDLSAVIAPIAVEQRLAPAHRGDTFDVRTDRRWTRQGLDYLGDHPRGAVVVASQGVVRMSLAPGAEGTPARLLAAAWILALQVAAVAGTVLLARERRWADLALLVGAAVAYVLASVGPWMDVRFRVPLTPVLAVLAAHALARWAPAPGATAR